jgi:hypothetical protein
MLRVRITQKLSGSIDGIHLDRFQVGSVYDLGTSLGCYLMAIGAAEPTADERPALVLPIDELPPAAAPHDGKVVPFDAKETADDRRHRSYRRTRNASRSHHP